MTMATMTRKVDGPAYSAGRARWATVKVETENAVYVGRLYVPETKKRVSDVLGDERPFLNLTEVSTNDAVDTEGFLAINKAFIRTLRILDEGHPEEVKPTLRRIGDPYGPRN
jgi:hypothetical protein